MIRNTLTACAALLALSSAAQAADVTWSDWLNRNNPAWKKADRENAWQHFRDGNLDCQKPVAVRKAVTRDPQGGVDVLAQDNDQGVVCLNADQADGRCDDYAVSFACPTGNIDVGDFEIEYDPADVSIGANGEVLVSGPVEFVFGEFYLGFADADLELDYVGGDRLELVSAVARGSFGSNLGPLDGADLLLGDGLIDVSLGYGDYSVIEDLDTPLNPENDVQYIFMSVSASLLGGGVLGLTDEFGLEPAGAEATMVIDPTTPTLYAYADIGDLFAGAPLPVTPNDVGVGISASDEAFTWSPAVDPYGTLSAMSQFGMSYTVLGNMWLEGGVTVGFAGVFGVVIQAEFIAQIDWDALLGGSLDFLDNIGANGDFAIELDLFVASMEFDLAEATLRYTREGFMGTSFLAVIGEADPSEMLLSNGLVDFIDDAYASAEVLMANDEFGAARVDASLDFGAASFGGTAEVDIDIYDDVIAAEGELDFGSTELDITVTSYGAGDLDVSGRLSSGWGNNWLGIWGRLSVSGGTGGLDVEAEGKACAVQACTGWVGVSLSFSGGGFSFCLLDECLTF